MGSAFGLDLGYLYLVGPVEIVPRDVSSLKYSLFSFMSILPLYSSFLMNLCHVAMVSPKSVPDEMSALKSSLLLTHAEKHKQLDTLAMISMSILANSPIDNILFLKAWRKFCGSGSVSAKYSMYALT